MNEYQLPTSCIVHLADSANFEGFAFNKQCNGLTDLCFESTNDTIHVTVGCKHKKPVVQRINRIINARNATIDFDMQQISCIFVAKYASNEGIYTPIG